MAEVVTLPPSVVRLDTVRPARVVLLPVTRLPVTARFLPLPEICPATFAVSALSVTLLFRVRLPP